jgi:hypothetical protein
MFRQQAKNIALCIALEYGSSNSTSADISVEPQFVGSRHYFQLAAFA